MLVQKSVTFASERGLARVVHRLSYSVSPAETLAIIGESGSGKTVSARAVGPDACTVDLGAADPASASRMGDAGPPEAWRR